MSESGGVTCSVSLLPDASSQQPSAAGPDDEGRDEEPRGRSSPVRGHHEEVAHTKHQGQGLGGG